MAWHRASVLLGMRALGRLSEARALLKRHFGFGGFRPAQLRIIGPLLAGRDVLGVLPTGGGKSLCYQVPALLGSQLAVIVSPLISLMQDQVGALQARGVPAAMLNGAMSSEEEHTVRAGLSRQQWKLLYVAPERLQSLLPSLPPVGLLAIDEAHCVSEWGLSFRPAYRRLGDVRTLLGGPQTVALTGTATPQVRRDIAESLALESPEVVVGSFDRPNLYFAAQRCEHDAARFERLRALLEARDVLTLVYAPTRKLVEDLTRSLLQAGHRAAPYHAGLEHGARRQILARFLANRLQVVVATSAFGMGIDQPHVRQVVHWGPPGSPEAYYQEAGRAGRDGAPATCLLLYTRQDLSVERRRRKGSQSSRQAAERARFDAMTKYLAARSCRRAALLAYFGELLSGCTGCDRCERGEQLHRPATRGHRSEAAPDPRTVRRLLAWRVRVARRTRLPAACLLDSPTIVRLAIDRPGSAGDLADVPGVGPELAARFGKSLLRAVNPPQRSAEPAPVSDPLLYERLRQWRGRIAVRAGMPAYCVLSNRALRGIAEARPAGRSELAGVPGVGPRTLVKHAADVLNIVRGCPIPAGAAGSARSV